MNGISSNVGVKINTSAVSVNKPTSDFFGNVKNVSDEYEELNYSGSVVKSTSADLNGFFKSINEEAQKNWIKTFDGKFMKETAAYIFAKNYGGEIAKMVYNWATSGKGGTTGATITTSCVSGFLKLIFGVSSGKVTDTGTALAELVSGGFGKDMIKGLSKPLIDKVTKDAYARVLSNLSKSFFPNQSSKVTGNMIKALEKDMARTIKTFNIEKGKTISNLLFKAGIVKDAYNMALGSGVDYVASVVTTAVGAYFKGEFNVTDFASFANTTKLGENLLISSYKTIFGIAFERMFTFAGPAGKKFGKTLGTVVGASIGNFWVSAFDGDEAWCAVAGAATIVGAVGGIWAGAAIAAACSASVPVAGWIVGAAIIVGATIATAVIYAIYWFFG